MQRKSCPLCNGGDLDYHDAAISQFVAVRCGFSERSTLSKFCRQCQFVFFERGLTDMEAARLYSGYREESYNKLRLSLEPSYAGVYKYVQR